MSEALASLNSSIWILLEVNAVLNNRVNNEHGSQFHYQAQCHSGLCLLNTHKRECLQYIVPFFLTQHDHSQMALTQHNYV